MKTLPLERPRILTSRVKQNLPLVASSPSIGPGPTGDSSGKWVWFSVKPTHVDTDPGYSQYRRR